MSFVKMRSAAASASGPLKSHFLSGDSSQTPTCSRTVLCSATASPKWLGQYQPSQSISSTPIFCWTSSKAVRTMPVSLIRSPW